MVKEVTDQQQTTNSGDANSPSSSKDATACLATKPTADENVASGMQISSSDEGIVVAASYTSDTISTAITANSISQLVKSSSSSSSSSQVATGHTAALSGSQSGGLPADSGASSMNGDAAQLLPLYASPTQIPFINVEEVDLTTTEARLLGANTELLSAINDEEISKAEYEQNYSKNAKGERAFLVCDIRRFDSTRQINKDIIKKLLRLF